MSFSIEKRYQERGLTNYRITSVEDIHAIYEYDLLSLKGYSDLTDENKQLIQAFMINFYNAIGMDNRDGLKPQQVNFVQQTDYGLDSKDSEGNVCYRMVSTEFKRMNAKGRFVNFLKFVYEEDELSKCKQVVSSFLRIDYKWGKRKEWLHVVKPDKWY